jgi:hypothetical protein
MIVVQKCTLNGAKISHSEGNCIMQCSLSVDGVCNKVSLPEHVFMSHVPFWLCENRIQQGKQCTYKYNRVRSHNHLWHGKAIIITYSEGMSVALVFQHANCMCHIILSSVACLAVPCFSTLSQKKLLNVKCVF